MDASLCSREARYSERRKTWCSEELTVTQKLFALLQIFLTASFFQNITCLPDHTDTTHSSTLTDLPESPAWSLIWSLRLNSIHATCPSSELDVKGTWDLPYWVVIGKQMMWTGGLIRLPEINPDQQKQEMGGIRLIPSSSPFYELLWDVVLYGALQRKGYVLENHPHSTQWFLFETDWESDQQSNSMNCFSAFIASHLFF